MTHALQDQPIGTDTATTARGQHEIDHGKLLAAGNPELTWGWDTPAGSVRANRRADKIIRAARLGEGVSCLEVGCGTGLFTEKFAATGASVLAVDISAELLDYAAKRGLPADRVSFRCTPFEACDDDGPFDAIVGSSVIHHLDIEACMVKCYQLLAPGGRIGFAEPNMLNPQIAVQKNVGFVKKMLGDSPDETAIVPKRLTQLLESIGYVEVSVEPFDWLHPWTPRPLIGMVSGMGRVLEATPGLRRFAGSVCIAARRPA